MLVRIGGRRWATCVYRSARLGRNKGAWPLPPSRERQSARASGKPQRCMGLPSDVEILRVWGVFARRSGTLAVSTRGRSLTGASDCACVSARAMRRPYRAVVNVGSSSASTLANVMTVLLRPGLYTVVSYAHPQSPPPALGQHTLHTLWLTRHTTAPMHPLTRQPAQPENKNNNNNMHTCVHVVGLQYARTQ